MKPHSEKSSPSQADPASAGQIAAEQTAHTVSDGLSGMSFTEKEKKAMFLNVVVGIVLLEFAVTVGAVVYSITNADRSAAGALKFNFPWLGYLISVAMVPVLVMLVLHLVSLGFSRNTGQEASAAAALEGTRAGTFFALVRGAPTVILFAGFVLMGAAVYYLDGVMALLLKLGDSFQTVAVWLVGALGVAFCVNAVARAVLTYKTRKLEAEYAFRREVFERTGTILMSSEQVALRSSEQVALLPGALEPTAGQREITVQPVVVEIPATTASGGDVSPPEGSPEGSDMSTRTTTGLSPKESGDL